MKTITIRELHLKTGRWVREAAQRKSIVITDHKRPVATLTAFDSSAQGKPLPDREEAIRKRTRIRVDSARLLSEMRDRA